MPHALSLLFSLVCFSRFYPGLKSPDKRRMEVILLRRTILSFCVVAFMGIANLALAQEFSADIVNLKKEGGGLSKIYVSSSKMRLETHEKGGLTAMIFDPASQKNIAIMSEQHMYMEMPIGQGMPMAYNFWRPPDPNDACPQWKEMADRFAEGSGKKLTSCRKVGGDSLNGRSAVKYEGTDADGKTGYVWVDPRLRYIVKVLGAEGSGFELRNIQEGSQPASLFEVPAGYTKLDLGAKMRQHQ